MATRLDIELTSERGDGTWTWRAAGAKEPKGALDASLLPEGLSVGSVVRADAEFFVDGLTIVSVQAPKTRSGGSGDVLEILGSGKSEPLVTQKLAPGRRSRDDRGDRGRRGGDGDKRGRGRGRGRNERGSSDRGRDGRGGDSRRSDGRSGSKDRGRGDSRRSSRPARQQDTPRRTRKPRLRPRRVHRDAAVRALPAEQQQLAELVLRGGVPAVRDIVEAQHAQAKQQDQPLLALRPLVGLAEDLAPRLKAAEWLDRADAALDRLDDCELRDLRSVVASAESAEREPGAHELAERLRAGLAERVDREHREWLAELGELLGEGRIIRALKRSSEPPKAGVPLPPDLATGLAEQATAGLTGDMDQERFAAVLDAVSFSPVHGRVAATSIPANPSDELLAKIRRIAKRVPGVAAQFGIGPGAASPPPAAD